jgi:hypothetical protein
VRNLLALFLLLGIVGLVALAAYGPTPEGSTTTPPLVTRAVETLAQVRLHVLTDRLARVDRGLAVVAERVRAGGDYDRGAARALLCERDLLSEMIEVEHLKEGGR